MLRDMAGARLGGLNTTRLIRGPDMKRTKLKDPPHRLNLRAWERNIRPLGPEDPPVRIREILTCYNTSSQEIRPDCSH